MPKVSVIMAAYNHERFVGAAVESVLMQSLEDIELCVTDDQSPDGTADVIAAITDRRVRLHRFERNSGVTAALNDAIRRSTGEYIAVLNSDDLFLSDKLRSQAEYLDAHPEIGAVFGYPEFIDESGDAIPPEKTFMERAFEVENRDTKGWLRQFFYYGNCLCHPSVMIRRVCHDKVGLYDERFAQVHDFELWLRLLRHFRIELIPEKVMLFRILAGEGNASAPRPEVSTRVLWEFEKAMQHFLELDDSAIEDAFGADLDRLNIDRSMSAAVKLGLLAMEADTIWVRRFGLDALFNSIPPQAQLRESHPGVSPREFISLTGAGDIYNFVQASQALSELNSQIVQLRLEQESPRGERDRKVRAGWIAKLLGRGDPA